MKKHAIAVALAGTAMTLTAAPVAAEDGEHPTLQDAIGSDDFTISASVRTRYETYENPFRSSGADAADLLSFRTIVKAGYDAGPVRFGGQLQDARAYWADAGTRISKAEVNALEFEGAYQSGSIRASSSADAAKLDVSAYTLAAQVGYTFNHASRPRLSLVGDIASGDNTDSTSYNRFDTLFGIRRGDWGPSSSLYGPLSRNNICDLGAKFEIKPSKRVDAFVAARTAWLDERTDAFAKTGIRDASGQSGRHAGEQIEARLRYWIAPNFAQLDVGGAALSKGKFLRSAPNVSNTRDTRYAYADLYFKF
ncbi:alginate export family protein [Erythrobacter sp. SCSIO 43205]|uniref:alginate export family protein n=1 Tax=Erythrobacter sp. SCSIO 43205 TaxID=2779361 RepID=UPI001CA7C42D|nr:alginate export family protein [Erythrobacter sp. SCSIO 43205]UAB79286.1 alginate export family protein [Erythrobacter sp. SCSIO 43205]